MNKWGNSECRGNTECLKEESDQYKLKKTKDEQWGEKRAGYRNLAS